MVDCFSAEQRFFESNTVLISIFYINDHGTYIRWLIALVQSRDSLKSNTVLISIFYINGHGTYIRWMIALVQSRDSLKVTLS